MNHEGQPDSTLAGVPGKESSARSRWAARFFVVFLVGVVAAGLAGLLGVYTAATTSSGGGYGMQLLYPAIARPGLDVTWKLTVTHPGGFPGPVRVAITGDYFDIFETQAFYPTPSIVRRDGRYVYMTFPRPPAGDTFVMSYDTYVQPYTGWGRSGTVAIVHGTRFLDSVSIHTWLAP